jgi:HEAT repeat protein
MFSMLLLFALWTTLMGGVIVKYHRDRQLNEGDRWSMFCAEWKSAANELGLDFGPSDQPGLVKLVGRVGEFDLVVDTANNTSRTLPVLEETRFQIFSFGKIPRDLHIERLQSSHKKRRDGPQRILIGDDEFDAAVAVYGDEMTVRALLDAATRAVVMERVVKQGSIVHGSTVFLSQIGHVAEKKEIIEKIEHLAGFGDRLRLDPSSLCEKLLSAARREPLTKVRQRAFHLLFANFSKHDALKRMIVEILRDPDPLIRLFAAQAQGEDGVARVEAIAIDPDIPPKTRIVAYCYLVQWVQRPDTRALIEQALVREPPMVAQAIIQFIGRIKCGALLDRVVTVFASAMDHGIVLACIDTLRELQDPSPEPYLIRALGWPDPETRTAAARALEQIGTIRSVEALLPLTQGFLVEPAVKEAARAALAAVRSRLSGAESGCLSLATGEEQRGALSVRIDCDGALSLQSDDRGALSIESADDASC